MVTGIAREGDMRNARNKKLYCESITGRRQGYFATMYVTNPNPIMSLLLGDLYTTICHAAPRDDIKMKQTSADSEYALYA